MVGFGSSLRLARRPGWEGAYLDYETLKLLLSQIEAVYEEEGHRQRLLVPEDGTDGDGGPRKKRDFRKDLFLESDSDAAYASIDDEEEQQSFLDESHEDLEEPAAPRQAKPFSLSYSHEATSSDEESIEPGCGAGVSGSFSTWTTWTTWDKTKSASTETAVEPKMSRRKSKKRRSVGVLGHDDDAFYVNHTNSATTDTFFLAGNEDSSQHAEDSQNSSILNAPFKRTLANENASLLAPATPARDGSSLYSFQSGNGSLTPPNRTPMFVRDSSGGDDVFNSGPPSVPIFKTDSTKFVQERTRARNLRRKKRKQLKAIRLKREKKVPRYIRTAHTKARAITERFLGLLRAETEKVTLFAQARLGELADTAGSLRFPSFDDTEYGSASRTDLPNRSTSYGDYPLSDGGRHPSASSSDDDGAGGGNAVFPWSDSSNEDEKSGGSLSKLPLVYSVGGLSDESRSRSNRSKRMSTPQKSNRKRSEVKPEIKDGATLKAVRRQIDHFTELRNTRPVFLRNDHILGEDMLLISAVEEADGYTAVGVELMHVLKFICVNLIAVRKICRKHDRLLMNRMLGGYYHRTRITRDSSRGNYSHIEDADTLGGLLARVSGDIYEAHPALIGQMNHFKLVGVYDKKIQKLANSRTVQVVSSCLALALAESEVAHSRADALTKLNPASSLKKNGKRSKYGGVAQSIVDSDDEDGAGPPSTASTVSLTRLRFTVTSIFSLREAARYKVDLYGVYLSRSVMAFTGQPVVGEGLDGCARETLDFFVSYQPDAALFLDCDVLFKGLKSGRWMRLPIGEVMISTLATAMTAPPWYGELAASNAVSILPESKNLLIKVLLKGRLPSKKSERSGLAVPEVPPVALRLNRITYFLFMVSTNKAWLVRLIRKECLPHLLIFLCIQMNYFVVHATTSAYVVATGIPSVYSATVIGAPGLSAILVAFFHCFLLSRESATHRFRTILFRRLFLFSAFMAIVGNVIHALGVDRGSVDMAILGRFLMGFSSAEILHRQMLATCLPSHVVSEAAQLVRYRVAGVACGLFLGSVAETIPIKINRLGVRALQSASWLMVLVWVIHFVRILFQFTPKSGRGSTKTALESGQHEREGVEDTAAASGTDYDSSSSESDGNGQPNRAFSRSSSGTDHSNSRDSLKATYGAVGVTSLLPTDTDGVTESTQLRQTSSSADHGWRKRGFQKVKTFASRIQKLLAYHIAIPLALSLLFYVYFSLEVMFTACPIVTDRYFGWSGARAGVMLGCLAIIILPVDFMCEMVSRRYEERTVMKVRSNVFCWYQWFTLPSSNQNLLGLSHRSAPCLLSALASSS